MGKGAKPPVGKNLQLVGSESNIKKTKIKTEQLLPIHGPAHEVALIDDICMSPRIARSGNLPNLLRYLYLTRAKGQTAEVIERHHFGRKDESEAEDGEDINAQGVFIKSEHTRERIFKLRPILRTYEKTHPLNDWVVELPLPPGPEGYKLKIEAANWRASERIWMDHMRHANDVVVLSGSHLFFFNQTAKTVIRYTDFNESIPENESDDDWKGRLFDSLEKIHPESIREGYEPWADTYLASGDILAHEKISKWFFQNCGVHVERRTTHGLSKGDIDGKTPIYIGRTQTNPRIRALLKDSSLSHLRYSIKDPHRIVQIRDMRATEESQVKLLCDLDKNGLVAAKKGYVFALLTRARNPYGHGSITIITCDYYAPAIAKVAEVLTDDRWAASILEKSNWPKNPYLPGSFQMLFRLRVSEDLMHDKGNPELVCAALYDVPLAAVS